MRRKAGFNWVHMAWLLLAALLVPVRPASALERDNWDIRVVLTVSKPSLQVGGNLAWTADGKEIGTSTDAVEIKRVGEQVKLVIGGKGFTASRFVASPVKNMCRWNSHNYRGRFELFAAKREGCVVLLNVLPLEQYLLGCVGCEMPASWPADAVKAQAVAARTYAVSRMLGRSALSFDVYADQSDQVYLGYDREDPRISDAVRGTAGQILTYEGSPISAMYCSDCGTSTRNGRAPYLKSVPSPAPDSPNASWTVSLDQSKLSALVAKAGGKIGRVSLVEAENDPQSGHLLRLNCTGERGCYSIGANELRKLMGLSVVKSTQIEVRSADGSAAGKAARPAMGGSAPPSQARPEDPLPLESIDVLAASIPAAQEKGDYEAAPLRATADPALSAESAGRSVSISVLQGYSKPWIAWSAGNGAAKLKLLYCYDGQSLARCNREICVIAPGSAASGEVLARSTAGVPAGTQRIYIPQADGVSEQDYGQQRAKSADLQPPAPVPASTSVKVGEAGILLCGSGYGHGVGMSQYGARELARQGYGWQEILLHFYSGVQLELLQGELNSMFIADAQAGLLEDPGGVVDVALAPGEEVGEDSGEQVVVAGEKSGQGDFYDPFTKH